MLGQLWAVCGEVEHCGGEHGGIKVSHFVVERSVTPMGMCLVTYFVQPGPTSTSFEPLPEASLNFDTISGVTLMKS